MADEAILLPMGLLVLWTATVLTLIPLLRFRAAAKGVVTADDFRMGESAAVPAWAALANRNYMNLLELPVLFYVLCITLFVTGRTDGLFVELAWAYVGLRIAHSLIHMTYNTVMHRMLAFTFSTVVLMGMWVLFLLRLTGLA